MRPARRRAIQAALAFGAPLSMGIGAAEARPRGDAIMIDVRQFRELIVRPTLKFIGLHSPAAENLVIGTALVESGLAALKQHGAGPALGLYQIEPATHRDMWQRFLMERRETRGLLALILAPTPDKEEQLVSNLRYATAMCRIIYWSRPGALPAAEDIDALGAYWKRCYNTPLGAGKAEEFARRYRAAHR